MGFNDETNAEAVTARDVPATEAAPGKESLRLTHVTVEQFRNIVQPQTVNLDEGLTVLVGANGSGKTTVLDAIRCLLDPSGAVGYDSATITGRFVTDDGLEERVRAHFDGTKWQRTVLTLVDPDLGKPPEKATAPELRTFLGTTGGLKDELASSAHAQIEARPASELSESWIPLTHDVDARLPRLIRFDAESATDPHAEVEKLAQREFTRLVQQEKYADLTRELGERFGEDIAPTLQAINDTVSRRCGEMVSQLVASASIDFAKIKPTVDVRATTNDTDLSAAQLSLGQRRRMGLAVHEALTQVLQANGASGWDLILYDEPDTHLDFLAQRRLADVLRQQANVSATQVVVATHAPRLIDQAPPQALVHLRLEHGNAVVENLADLMGSDDAECDPLRELDHSLGNSALLAERCIVITEGSSDIAALQELYRRRYEVSLRNDGVVIIDGGGGENAIKLARKIIECWRRNVILVLDRDKDTDRSLRALREQHGDRLDAYVIGERELEDCFSDECWAEALTAGFTLTEPWSVDDVSDLREKAREKKEGLSKTMQKKFLDNDLRTSKVDVARAVAQHIALDDLAPAITELLAQIQNDDRD